MLYLSRSSSHFDEIRNSDAVWPSWPSRPLNIWLVISAIFLKKDFSRSQPVTYIHCDVLMSRKRLRWELLLNCYLLYGLSNRGNSDDIESPSRSFSDARVSNVILRAPAAWRYACTVFAVIACPSVCHKSRVVPKRLNVGPRKQRHRIARDSSYITHKIST